MLLMNKILITILVASLIVFANLYCAIVAQADETAEVNIENGQTTRVLNNLFDALRTGDTRTLKRLFAGEMYAKNKTLLEQNAGYPDFLRTHYQDAIFTITEMTPYAEGVMAGFTVLLTNGSKQTIHMLLAKRAADTHQNPTGSHSLKAKPKKWFIIKQVEER